MTDAKTLKNYKVLKKFLNKKFPGADTALKFKTPFQLLIATILSAQCTDTLVNKVTEKLFKKYKRPEDFAKSKLANLQKDIYPVTFYRNKAKSIRKASEMIEKNFGGKVPEKMEELLSLPGVARKTANVVLGHAFKIASGIVVDTHVRRVSQRYGLTKNSDPAKIERDLMKIVPKKDWIKFSDQAIWFGRKICTARNNKCGEYPELKGICEG